MVSPYRCDELQIATDETLCAGMIMQSRSGTQDAPGGMAVDLLEVTCLRKQPWKEPRKTNAKARL